MNVNKRISSAVVIMACMLSLGGASAHAESPNIIFIFSDDHTWQTISAYGHPLSKVMPTPNIDRIGAEGIRFDRCLVPNSICAPSRATVLTGKYSHLNGQRTNGGTFNGDQMTFPKLLQKADYQTAIIGKWHLKSTPTGFDHHEVMKGQGRYYNPILYTDGKPTTYEGHNTDVVMDRSLNWLKSRNGDQPFMLMCQFKATHGPFQPALRHLGELDDVTIPEPDNLFDDYSGRSTSPAKLTNLRGIKAMPKITLSLAYKDMEGKPLREYSSHFEEANKAFEQQNLQGDARTRWNYQRFLKLYLLTSKGIDENVGRLLDYLEESGLAKNTIVIYTSDQGVFLGEHGWFDKRWMYEESLKTPLLVRWPGVTKPGQVNSNIVSNLDFAPMFLDLAGAPIPDAMQGSSIVPLLKGETPSDWRESFYYQYHGEFRGKNYTHGVPPHDGVTTERYKLIHYKYEDVDEWEFYDMKNDPSEMKSEYKNPEYAQRVSRLKKELTQLKKNLKAN
jgi:arylsulfatase A-like enzyme